MCLNHPNLACLLWGNILDQPVPDRPRHPRPDLAIAVAHGRHGIPVVRRPAEPMMGEEKHLGWASGGISSDLNKTYQICD